MDSKSSNTRKVPKVSVLVVTYNHEEFIGQALDSVFMQTTGFDFEVVIADDCSQDATLDIVKRYQTEKPDVRILPLEKNVGITRNYQRGFAACRGEFVAVLEGDDFWTSPTKLKTLVTFLEQHPECSFCFHRFLRHDEPANGFKAQPPFEIHGDFALYQARQLVRGNFVGNFSACCYRREIVRQLDPALFEMKVYDWMFNIVVALSGPFGYIPEIMSVYRAHPAGTWSGNTLDHQRQEVLGAIDSYDSYLNLRFHSEFQMLKEYLHAELAESDGSDYQASYARLRDHVRPFVPPVLGSLARNIYRGTRRIIEPSSPSSRPPIPRVKEKFSREGLRTARPDWASDDPISFTAHNIRLDNGEYTKPELGMEMSQYPWFVSAKRILSELFPGDKSGYSVLDLGCLEGGYTVEFARMGFESLGLEIRERNIAACEYVKSRVDLPNLSFVKDDVWNVKDYGPFDIAFCCGILYHLERPRAFLKLLSKVVKRVLILQTHFASDKKPSEFNLSKITRWEGATGRWFTEYDNPPDAESREQSRWAAWTNEKSFWLTRPWILQSMHDVGFDLVFEQFDSLAPSIVSAMTDGSYHLQDRGTFVGIRTNANRPLV